MSRREYRPPREEGELGLIDGWPDVRGLPTIRIVCEGRPETGRAHPETVVGTYKCHPFDPTKGERGEWFWDEDVATGGGARHPTTRARERKHKRKVTAAEEEQGWRPGYTDLPKRSDGFIKADGTVRLKCPRCRCDLPLKEPALQETLNGFLLADEKAAGEMAELLHIAPRKISLLALIRLRTTPKKDGRSGRVEGASGL